MLLRAYLIMERLKVFLLILTIAIGVLLILVVASWYLATTSQSYYQSSWMSQMWGGMMGGGMMGNGSAMGPVTYSAPYLWLVPVGLIAVVIFAVLGVSFYLVFPEIKSSKSTCALLRTEQGQTVTTSTHTGSNAMADLGSSACEVLLKTMTSEEQKVLNVLRAHNGKYLQKYIAKEADLSRLKTHRIIARFAQRGIVKAKQFGNTNEISLSEWVVDKH